MPIESAIYLNTLDVTQPTAIDGVQQGDDHLRLLKAVLKTTFPNIAGAVSATHTDLSNVAGLVNNGTVTIPAPSLATTHGGELVLHGASTLASVALENLSGTLDIITGGTTIAALTPTGQLSLTGPVSASAILLGGNPLIPTGIVCMWSGSLASVPAGWHLCDGTTGTPDLRDRFVIGAGSSYVAGATGGASSLSPSTSSAGGHNHTGLSNPAGSHTPSVTIDVQGSHSHSGATGGHALAISEMPYHDHGMGATGIIGGLRSDVAFTLGGPWGATAFVPQGGGLAHTHPMSVDGAHAHNATAALVPNHQHALVTDGTHTHTVTFDPRPPFYALAFIMKL